MCNEKIITFECTHIFGHILILSSCYALLILVTVKCNTVEQEVQMVNNSMTITDACILYWKLHHNLNWQWRFAFIGNNIKKYHKTESVCSIATTSQTLCRRMPMLLLYVKTWLEVPFQKLTTKHFTRTWIYTDKKLIWYQKLMLNDHS